MARSSPTESLRALVREAKRRKVFRTAMAYTIASLAVIAAASDLFPALRLPEWSVTLVASLAIAGLPLVLVLAWTLEWTPAGVRREQDFLADQVRSPARAARPDGTGAPEAGGETDDEHLWAETYDRELTDVWWTRRIHWCTGSAA